MISVAGRELLGGRRVALLRALGTTGSISAAARAVGMSYKAAWEAVEAINNLSDQPLVLKEAGGRHGGGSRLTDYGERLLAMHDRLEEEYQRRLETLGSHLGDEELFRLLERMQMKSSARNQFGGKVVAVRAGPVNAEVEVRIGDSLTVVATITTASVENLELTEGSDVFVLIKSTSIILTVEDDDIRMSTRNRICGSIDSINDGPVSSEVSLDLGSGKWITAVVTRESRDALDLDPGMACCALFKASSVILATAR